MYECGLCEQRRGKARRWTNCFVNLPFSFKVVPETKHVPQGELMTFSIRVFQKEKKIRNVQMWISWLYYSKTQDYIELTSSLVFIWKPHQPQIVLLKWKQTTWNHCFLHFRCCARVNEKNTSKYCLSFFPFYMVKINDIHCEGLFPVEL